jgi:hypothetical protein
MGCVYTGRLLAGEDEMVTYAAGDEMLIPCSVLSFSAIEFLWLF